MGKYAGSSPKNLTAANDEFAAMIPGELVYDNKNRKGYMYVQFDNGAGDVAWRNEIDGRIYIMLTSQGGAGPGNTIHQEADPAWKVGLQLFWPPLP